MTLKVKFYMKYVQRAGVNGAKHKKERQKFIK